MVFSFVEFCGNLMSPIQQNHHVPHQVMVMVRFKLGATRGAEDGHPRIEVLVVMWRADSRRGRCFLVDVNNIKVLLW